MHRDNYLNSGGLRWMCAPGISYLGEPVRTVNTVSMAAGISDYTFLRIKWLQKSPNVETWCALYFLILSDPTNYSSTFVFLSQLLPGRLHSLVDVSENAPGPERMITILVIRHAQ